MLDLVQVTTRDGVRLDGTYQESSCPRSAIPVEAFCLVHGTGSNFYSSTLFDHFAERLLSLGCGVLRINTRGHDGISTAVTARGGKRAGAAYEVVDDCRHDLVAWMEWLVQRAGPRVGLIGHSLGAVKSLYALAQEPQLSAACIVAISPPRLSYSWFCSSPEKDAFLDDYSRAALLVEQGEPARLLEVKLPLPFVVTAAGYVEKYGPDERYNYLPFVRSLRCPALFTFGELEVANNMAFRAAPTELAELAKRQTSLSVATIAGADHFYAGVRDVLLQRVESWLQLLVSSSGSGVAPGGGVPPPERM